MLRDLAKWLLPTLCHHCGALADADSPLCDDCLAQLASLTVPPRQIGTPPRELWLHAAYAFAGPARSLVHAFKYRGGAALAPWLAARIAAQIPPPLATNALLVPVPAHPAHARQRGYNQSLLLTRALARDLRLPLYDVIVRRRAVRPQTGGTRAARHALPPDAFELAPGVTRTVNKSPHFPTNVLACDDVATTGCTLEVCASLLSGLFRSDVHAVTFASAEESMMQAK